MDNNAKLYFGFIISFAVSSPSHAHELWVERGSGDTVKIILGELPEPEPGGGSILLDELKGIKFIGADAGPLVRRPGGVGPRTPVAIGPHTKHGIEGGRPQLQPKEHLEASIKGRKDVRVEAYYKPWVLPTGVSEGAIFRARYGRTESAAKMDFEVVPTTRNGGKFKALLNGEAVTGRIFDLIRPDDSWQELTTDANGVVVPDLSKPGRYILSAYYHKKGDEAVDGQAVSGLWYGATLTFVVR